MDLSVVICAYNAEARLALVLDALARQDSPPAWEVIVVDNNSRDRTPEVARAWADRLPLRVVTERRQGLIYAREAGAREAQGEVLSYIDDDNVVERGWCRACVSFARSRARAGVFGGVVRARLEDESARPSDFDARFAPMLAIRDLGPVERRLMPPGDDPPCGAGMTGRAEVFRRILLDVGCSLTGRKGKKLAAGEDSEIGWLAHRLGWEMWYTPTLRMEHVIPPGRLRPEYLERLEIGMARTWPWLRLLSGREARRGRAAYAACALRCEARALSARARAARLGTREGEPGVYHRFFARRLRAEAGGYWDMALRLPLERVMTLGAGEGTPARAAERGAA